MNNLSVIDRFMQAFIRYIDSGFGLLGGDVHFLTVTLIGIDITLAGLFWAMGGEDNVIGRFIKKILYIGAFAFILNSFSTLADIIFRSFAHAGLTAGGGGMTAADLLRPGRVASTGFTAAWPLLNQISDLTGPVAFFTNFMTIAVLLFAWAIVILAFFVLAIQMFVTIVEFKLTTLAGFILVPFALWNRTSFLAERVLGNVVSSGIKVMVQAVIVGIGSNFVAEFTASMQGQEPDLGAAMSLTLGALTLFGLGIFGPGIASGLVSGAPQLGAGAALGTTVGAAGITMLAGGAAIGGARALGGAVLGAVRAGTSMGSAASTAYTLGNPHSLTAAPSPYLLSAGSVISASLITGLRSDLPGLVTAQVTAQVLDSPTGRILLIPQGSRLIGSYDSVVAFGQKRALIVWQRVVLPDGSSLRIDNVPATDASGYAGLQDNVDFHTWALLKGVALSTLLGVGSQLTLTGESDLVQAIRQSTQQNVSRAGDQLTSRNLNIQPTITIRPGAIVRLIVHKDLVLAPWRGKEH